MELIHGTHRASKFTPEVDILSSMPENVITDILHCLPIQDAVRTGILSRDWRFKWTMISQLVFDLDFFEYVINTQKEDDYGRTIISRLLFQLKGTITKFTLYIEAECYFENINNWVMFLSGRGIEEFTLINWHDTALNLPTHLFSCPKLKHLMLCNCLVPPVPTLHSFPNLLSLDLSYVVFETYTCGEFLTRCPLLEILSITTDTTCVVKQDEISKLENLKVLSFPLCKLNNTKMITSSSISQFMSFFSKLQELTLNFLRCKFLADARKSVSCLPCLKSLELLYLDFGCGSMVSCAVELICSSPNLQTLEIIGVRLLDSLPPPVFSSSEVDYSRMGKLQLKEVWLKSINGWENEVYLIKSLLACSPLLKEMVIYSRLSHLVLDRDHGKMMFATDLLKLHRASPIADISLYWMDSLVF